MDGIARTKIKHFAVFKRRHVCPPKFRRAMSAATNHFSNFNHVRDHAARTRLEYDGVLHTIEKSRENRVIDGTDHAEAQHRNTPSESELIQEMHQRAVTRTHREEAHKLALARARQRAELIDLKSSRHANKIECLTCARSMPLPARKNQLINASWHAVGPRFDRVRALQQRAMHDDRDWLSCGA